jgi:hypothetical protein
MPLYLPPAGIVKLCNWQELAANSTTLPATAVPISSAPYPMLWIPWRITGYQGNDIIGIRFNGDTAANYQDRHGQMATAATTFTNNQTLSTTFIRMAGNAVTTGRAGDIIVSNRSASPKIVAVRQYTGSGSAATASVIDLEGGGEWENTTSVITSVQFVTATSAMNIGTGFQVFGIGG